MRNRSDSEKARLALLWTAPVAGMASLFSSASAQVVPVTGGANTQVSQNGDIFDISGGTQTEGNLFHEFKDFSVDDNQTANFLSNSSVFNIVGQVSGLSPSYINGLVQVSGSDANLYLVDPAGILFGPSGQLSLGGSFLATTADQVGFGENWLNVLGSNNDYSAFTGDLSAFGFTVDTPSSVVNRGDLAVEAGKSLVLIGNNVVNEGRLAAPGGEIGLVAVGRDTVRLGLPGSLLSLEMSESDFSTGSTFTPTDLPTLVTGDTSGGATRLVVNSSGKVSLTGLQRRTVEPEEVAVTGEITTRTESADGGTIALLGRSIDVIAATVDASGKAGGSIRIGRELGEENLPDTDIAWLAGGTVVRADGLNGAGGDIAVGSERSAYLSGGLLSAKGRTQGGFVETSADYLFMDDLAVDASGEIESGQWLIDPVDIEIVDTVSGANQIASSTIENSLDSGTDLTIETTSGTGGSGDISLLDSISQTGASGGRLTLTGRRFSTNGSTIDLASTGGLTFNLNAVNPEAQASGNSVKSAIAAIGNVNGDRTINLGAGTYNFANTTTINTDVDIVGASSSTTQLNLDADARRLFSIGADSTVSISDVALGVAAGRQGGGIVNRGALELNNIYAAGNTADVGGAIISAPDSRLDIFNSTLENNLANDIGGAIFSQGDRSTVNIVGTRLENNQAGQSGGALYIAEASTTIEDSFVRNNTAILDDGGGIRTNSSNLTVRRTVIENNQAGDDGGGAAIQGDSESALFEDVTFRNNATTTFSNIGGAVALWDSAVATFSNSVFERNRAAGDGGAIHSGGASQIVIDGSRFVENMAGGSGGGIHMQAGRIDISGGTRFERNVAITEDGGGLSAEGNVVVNLRDVAFSGNSAGEDGGGAAAEFFSVVTADNVQFIGNSADDDGGGLYLSESSQSNVTASRFENNSAGDKGGGLYASQGSSATVEGVFFNNRAVNSGGGLNVNDGSVVNVANATFEENAANIGGALSVDTNSSGNISASQFNRNEARSDGGGVHVIRDSRLTIADSSFVGNQADDEGGGLSLEGNADAVVTGRLSEVGGVVTSSTSFLNNVAGDDGGGISVENLATLELTGVNISSNVAGDDGGGLSATQSTSAIINNSYFEENTAADNGGGIYRDSRLIVSVEGETLTVKNSRFVRNEAASNGGGIFHGENSGNAVVVDSSVMENQSVASGGGIYASSDIVIENTILAGNTTTRSGGGLLVARATAEIVSSTFERNEAEIGGGAATFVADLAIRESEFVNNRAAIDGGGLRLFDGTVEIDNTEFLNNQSAYGGGLELSSSAQATVKNSEFEGNEASMRGGAIQVDDISSLAVESSTLANNQTGGKGGGLFNRGTAELVNTTLYENVAANDGGAIANAGSASITTVRNSTISHNQSAGVGGGIASDWASEVRVLNTIVAENNGASANDVSGRFVDEGNNLIGQSDGSTGFNASFWVGRASSPIDPLLAPLADNGGPTRTQLLSQDSVAIDAGANNNLLATDQRGLSRVVGAAVDIGAVELTVSERPDSVPPPEPPNFKPTFLDPTLSAQSQEWVAIAREDEDADNRTVSQLERTFGRSFEDYWDLPLGTSTNFNDVQNILKRAQEEYKVNSAIIYAMFLPEQIGLNTGENAVYVEPVPAPDDLLHLALVMPEGELVRYQLQVTREQATRQVDLLRAAISDPEDSAGYRPLTQQLYRWLLAPLEEDLAQQGIQNLMYALDTGLRNAPVTAMKDSQGFSLERYGISVVPNMGLTQVEFDPSVKRPTVAMGVSQFEAAAPLPAVPIELAVVEDVVSSASTVLDEGTTINALERVQALDKPGVLHLATHADFDHYSPESSTISMWNEPLSMKAFAELDWLESDLELLILSACSTAISSANAELGFAGLAAASGVDATVGSLWQVSDVGTLALMSEFYAQLERTDLRFEALRRAQLALLTGETRIQGGDLVTSRGVVDLPDEWGLPQEATLDHPFFWSAFTMVGNPW